MDSLLPRLKETDVVTAPTRPLLTAVMTVHNRAALTKRCLSAFWTACLVADLRGRVVIVDDGSTDETTELLYTEGSRVDVIRGDGNLYWNRGMRLGLERVLTTSSDENDFVLWLNNDSILAEDALMRLLAVERELGTGGFGGLVVGATVDPDTGVLTYGGMKSLGGIRRFSYKKVPLSDLPVDCDTINGNIVLMRVRLLRAVGNLDVRFEHAMGDIDFGLRAKGLGVRVICAPGVAGYCTNNSMQGTHRDAMLWSWQRLKRILGKKEVPMRSWLVMTKRHGGVFWVIFFIWPYLKTLGQGLMGDIRLVLKKMGT